MLAAAGGTGSLKHPTVTIHGNAINALMHCITLARRVLGENLTQRWC